MKNNNSIKPVVAVGIGAALFFVLGRFVAIPSPVPNTNISLQYAVLALLVLHHLLAGADEGNALRREQDGVYQFVDREQLVFGTVARDGEPQFVDDRVAVVAGDEVDLLGRGGRVGHGAV